MKEARHKRTHIVRFHFYEMSKTGKSIKRESRLVIASGWGEWGRSGVIAHGNKVSFWGDEYVLKLTVVMIAQLCEYIKKQ